MSIFEQIGILLVGLSIYALLLWVFGGMARDWNKGAREKLLAGLEGEQKEQIEKLL